MGAMKGHVTLDLFRPRICSNGGYYDGNFFQADYKDVFLSVQSFYPPAFLALANKRCARLCFGVLHYFLEWAFPGI